MKEIKLYLWSSDGYDCVDWDMDADISIEDYNRLVEILKQYRLDYLQNDGNDDCEFELFNCIEFTEKYINKTAPDIHSKLGKQANDVIEASFEEAMDSDALDIDINCFTYGYWIHYDWMNSTIDL